VIKRDLTTEEGIRGFLEEKKQEAEQIVKDHGVFPPVAFLASDDFPLGTACLRLGTFSFGAAGQNSAFQYIKDQVKKHSAYAVLFIVSAAEIVGYEGEMDPELIKKAVESGEATIKNMILFHIDHRMMGTSVWCADVMKHGELGELRVAEGAMPSSDRLRFIPPSEKAN
jgi:hypothetical protein